MLKDPISGREFLPRRTNQKFESRATQIRYNNLVAKKRRKAMAAINKPLNKNFRILNEIMVGKKEGSFHKLFLEGKGYHFGVHTHFEVFENKTYKAIYNFIIIPEDSDYIKFIKI